MQQEPSFEAGVCTTDTSFPPNPRSTDTGLSSHAGAFFSGFGGPGSHTSYCISDITVTQ